MVTKGKWERHNSTNGEHIWCGNEHIADFDGANANADAKLCVSAPTLYEELVEADRVICELCKRLNPQHATADYGKGCDWCKDRDSRLKAIAKAEGK